MSLSKKGVVLYKWATHPFWILDCRFWIIGTRIGNTLRRKYFHAFSPLIENLKSKIQNYLMTRSARTSTFGGIVRPICFAALRLMMSSNFIGCSTGRSAGLAPLRILST